MNEHDDMLKSGTTYRAAEAAAGWEPEGPEPERREVLIARLVDAEATEAQWQEFRALAGADSGLWRELGEAQRSHAVLCGAVGERLARIGSIDVDGPGPIGRIGTFGAGRRAVSGWVAAAAALGLAWWIGFTAAGNRGLEVGEGPGGGVAAASLLPVGTREDAVRAYLARGKRDGSVLGEVPSRVLVESRPLRVQAVPGVVDKGGYEVLYLRQFIERAVVEDLYRLGQDEAGGPVLVPASAPAAARGGPSL